MNIFKAYKESKISIFNIYQNYEVLRDNYLKKVEHWKEEVIKVEALEREKKILERKVRELEKKVGDPAEVVKKLLGRPIKFFDTYKMSEERYNAYYKEAQQVINNEAFQNELNCLVVDLVNSSARDTEDFRQVLNRRFTLCGIELLKQRIENMPKVTEEELPEDEELLESL